MVVRIIRYKYYEIQSHLRLNGWILNILVLAEGLFLLFIIFSKDFANSFFPIFTFTLWKIGCKIDMCSSFSSSMKIFCSSGRCFNCINFANRKQKSEAKIQKSKDLCSKNLKKSTCQFCSLFFIKWK